jgi:hypothetical protein
MRPAATGAACVPCARAAEISRIESTRRTGSTRFGWFAIGRRALCLPTGPYALAGGRTARELEDRIFDLIAPAHRAVGRAETVAAIRLGGPLCYYYQAALAWDEFSDSTG